MIFDNDELAEDVEKLRNLYFQEDKVVHEKLG